MATDREQLGGNSLQPLLLTTEATASNLNPQATSTPPPAPESPPANDNQPGIKGPYEPTDGGRGCIGCLMSPKQAMLRGLAQVAAFYRKVDANDKSIWLFSKESRTRQWFMWLTNWAWYKNTLLTLVMCNVVFLAMDDPTCTGECAATNALKIILSYLDYFFTACFTVDVICKTISMNFILGPGAYLKDGWNWIDFVTTFTSLLAYLPMGGGSNLTGIRAMRAMRPLRTLNAIPGLRRLVQTLLESVPLLIDVIMLLAWVFFVFGIVALQLFMGKMNDRCMVLEGTPDVLVYNWTREYENATWAVVLDGFNNPCASNSMGENQCPTEPVLQMCLETNMNPNFGYTNFDNFAWTALQIFQMLTLDNWTATLLYPLMDAIGPGAPLAYFILLVLFGAFFAMQLLVAILSSKFAEIDAQAPKKKKKKKRRRRKVVTTDDDEEEVDEDGQPVQRTRMQRFTRRVARKFNNFRAKYLQPHKRKHLPYWRQFFWDLCGYKWFSNVVTVMILINTCTMAMEFYGQSDLYTSILESINIVLTAGFILEFVFKHIGLGMVIYWSQPFNILDGGIVILSIIEIILTAMAAGGGAGGLQALRTFRLLRILRSLKLLSRVEGLRKLMKMVLKGFVALKDFILLLSLFIFIFSILGMQQFGGSKKFSCDVTDICRSNFNTLWEALYTVFQLLTGDNWVAIMWNGMNAKGVAACLYFICWIIIGNFVLLTLFLAILITNFTSDDPTEEPNESELEDNPYGSDILSESGTGYSESTHMSDVATRNAFQARVNERRGEKLDHRSVKRVKFWLVMMGFDHGLTMQEVEQCQDELDRVYALDPLKFEGDSNLDEEVLFARLLNIPNLAHTSVTRPSMSRGVVLTTSLQRGSMAPGQSSMMRNSTTLVRMNSAQQGAQDGRAADDRPSAPASLRRSLVPAGDKDRLMAWLSQDPVTAPPPEQEPSAESPDPTVRGSQLPNGVGAQELLGGAAESSSPDSSPAPGTAVLAAGTAFRAASKGAVAGLALAGAPRERGSSYGHSQDGVPGDHGAGRASRGSRQREIDTPTSSSSSPEHAPQGQHGAQHGHGLLTSTGAFLSSLLPFLAPSAPWGPKRSMSANELTTPLLQKEESDISDPASVAMRSSSTALLLPGGAMSAAYALTGGVPPEQYYSQFTAGTRQRRLIAEASRSTLSSATSLTRGASLAASSPAHSRLALLRNHPGSNSMRSDYQAALLSKSPSLARSAGASGAAGSAYGLGSSPSSQVYAASPAPSGARTRPLPRKSRSLSSYDSMTLENMRLLSGLDRLQSRQLQLPAGMLGEPLAPAHSSSSAHSSPFVNPLATPPGTGFTPQRSMTRGTPGTRGGAFGLVPVGEEPSSHNEPASLSDRRRQRGHSEREAEATGSLQDQDRSQTPLSAEPSGGSWQASMDDSELGAPAPGAKMAGALYASVPAAALVSAVASSAPPSRTRSGMVGGMSSSLPPIAPRSSVPLHPSHVASLPAELVEFATPPVVTANTKAKGGAAGSGSGAASSSTPTKVTQRMPSIERIHSNHTSTNSSMLSQEAMMYVGADLPDSVLGGDPNSFGKAAVGMALDDDSLPAAASLTAAPANYKGTLTQIMERAVISRRGSPSAASSGPGLASPGPGPSGLSSSIGGPALLQPPQQSAVAAAPPPQPQQHRNVLMELAAVESDAAALADLRRRSIVGAQQLQQAAGEQAQAAGQAQGLQRDPSLPSPGQQKRMYWSGVNPMYGMTTFQSSSGAPLDQAREQSPGAGAGEHSARYSTASAKTPPRRMSSGATSYGGSFTSLATAAAASGVNGGSGAFSNGAGPGMYGQRQSQAYAASTSLHAYTSRSPPPQQRLPTSPDALVPTIFSTSASSPISRQSSQVVLPKQQRQSPIPGSYAASFGAYNQHADFQPQQQQQQRTSSPTDPRGLRRSMPTSLQTTSLRSSVDPLMPQPSTSPRLHATVARRATVGAFGQPLPPSGPRPSAALASRASQVMPSSQLHDSLAGFLHETSAPGSEEELVNLEQVELDGLQDGSGAPRQAQQQQHSGWGGTRGAAPGPVAEGVAPPLAAAQQYRHALALARAAEAAAAAKAQLGGVEPTGAASSSQGAALAHGPSAAEAAAADGDWWESGLSPHPLALAAPTASPGGMLRRTLRHGHGCGQRMAGQHQHPLPLQLLLGPSEAEAAARALEARERAELMCMSREEREGRWGAADDPTVARRAELVRSAFSRLQGLLTLRRRLVRHRQPDPAGCWGEQGHGHGSGDGCGELQAAPEQVAGLAVPHRAAPVSGWAVESAWAGGMHSDAAGGDVHHVGECDAYPSSSSSEEPAPTAAVRGAAMLHEQWQGGAAATPNISGSSWWGWGWRRSGPGPVAESLGPVAESETVGAEVGKVGAPRSPVGLSHSPTILPAGSHAIRHRAKDQKPPDLELALLPHGGSLDGGGDSGPLAPITDKSMTMDGEEGEAAVQGGPEGQEQDPRYSEVFMQYTSMYVLKSDSWFRRKAYDLCFNKWFENTILVAILLSSICLAIDSPSVEPGSPLAQALHYTDIVFTSLFTFEMVLKMVVKGLVMHPGAYFRTAWDCLDGFIVIISLVSLMNTGGNLSIFRTLRLVRALRPLRMISRWRGMQLVVETLIQSLPAVGNVCLFGLFEFGVFGILGNQLFSGKFGQCNEAVIGTIVVQGKDQCVQGTFDCNVDDGDICNEGDTGVQREWVQPFTNFNNIGLALQTLFILATMDGFMDVTYLCIDAVGVNKTPKVDHSPFMGIYVIVFVFLGSFFWVNLLVSVIIDHYTRLISEQGDLLTSKQAKEWMKVFKFSAAKGDVWKKIPMPKDIVRRTCYKMASHSAFDSVIMAVIIANVLVMSMEHYGESSTFARVLKTLNYIFTCIFILEMIIKMLAMGLRNYFADNWNKLDFFIIVVGIPDLISELVPQLEQAGIITVFRVMRIGRMFKLIRSAKGLRTLFNTLISSLPAIFNVGSLLFLLMFVYAVLGMNLFGKDDFPDNKVSFDNFGDALTTLFRVFTGDGWSDVMAAAAGCDEWKYNCPAGGRAAMSAIFFCSFVVLANFVMLNLVIAVILDNFIESAQSEGLLKTTNFVDLMRMVITLKVFVRMLRIKIEQIKEKEAQQQALQKSRRKKSSHSVMMGSRTSATGKSLMSMGSTRLKQL